MSNADEALLSTMTVPTRQNAGTSSTWARAARSWVSPVIPGGMPLRSVTRTDAAAEDSGIFLGGWHAASLEDFSQGRISWFAYRVSAKFFPNEKASNNHLISAAECLAVAIAVALWGPDLMQSDSRVTVLGSDKWYSSSPNLSAALFCLVRACIFRKLRLNLSWVAGKENALADALSRLQVDPAAKTALQWLASDSRSAVRENDEILKEVLPDVVRHLTRLELVSHGLALFLSLDYADA